MSARAKNSRLFSPGSSPGVRRETSRRQDDARLAIERVDRLDRAMTDNGPKRGIDMRQHPLRFPERIGEDKARAPGGDVLAPPGVDRGKDVGLRAPAIDRQAERRTR